MSSDAPRWDPPRGNDRNAPAPAAARPSSSSPSSPPRALAHPLPAGMRDLLPAEARRRRALAKRVLDHFVLYGYEPVTLPAFEFAEVLERGLGTLDAADVLRFIEPESGEVAALRPDMTPQIARLVATRLADAPRPIRLCYEGTVLRRRQGRARRHRQIPQAGVELYGIGTLGGDLEILRLAASSVREAGLDRFVVDLGHAMIARALLDAVPKGLAPELSEVLEQKDTSRLAAVLASPRATDVAPRIAAAIAALPDLAGGGAADPDGALVFDRAAQLLSGTPAEAPLAELRALWDAARAGPELGPALRVDLGELRGLEYYTGAIFHVLADGPGEPIAAGGRYDDLLSRFGLPIPAVGFALSLDALAWARDAAGAADDPAPRVLLAVAPERAEPLAAALRRRGVPVVAHPLDQDPEGYAASWRFSHLVRERDGALVVEAAPGGDAARAGGAGAALPGLDDEAAAQAIALKTGAGRPGDK
ncbi:ATP phosphoribosyltransferase regulatory subunit [Sorangium sp. So ce131]|uniref:ATP phosphoribosyltransferase regulatory subunit n=1 Tax=Sorangium sp. So ce131 TaxID=3133282 RepID=UPI003F60FC51